MAETIATTVGGRKVGRRDIIIVETRPKHETDWKVAIDPASPDLSFPIGVVQPVGGVQ